MQNVIYAALALYILSSMSYFRGLSKKNPEKLSVTLAWLGVILNLVVLAMRTKITGRLPLTNSYDFLLCFTFITVFMYLLYGTKYPAKNAGGPVMLIGSLLFLMVSFFMPDQASSSGSLPPALKSPWLTVHVLTAAIAYGGFAMAAGLALVRFKSNQIKDGSVYNVVAFSFALLSLSVVFGAIWAEQAWGAYWSWDPKETWALITWIVYAAYLHLYRQKEWRGKPADLMVIAGFIIVLFTFFGVSYLFSGMHSYS